LLTSIAFLIVVASAHADDCLAVESVVTLDGRLSRHVATPDDIREGLAAGASWSITLAQPVCVNDDNRDTRSEDLDSMTQIVFGAIEPAEDKVFRHLLKLNRRVRLTGKLHRSDTGAYMTPVWLGDVKLVK
jgi:hypothetical protein